MQRTKFAYTVSILLALLLVAGLFKVFTYQPSRVFIERQLSSRLHLPVELGSVQVQWHRARPELVLQQLQVGAPSQPLLRLQRLRLGISVWQSLRHRRWYWSSIVVHDAAVDQARLPASKQDRSALELYRVVAAWFQYRLPHTRIDFKRVHFFNGGVRLPNGELKSLRASLTSRGYRIVSDYRLDHSPLRVQANTLLTGFNAVSPRFDFRVRALHLSGVDNGRFTLLDRLLAQLGLQGLKGDLQFQGQFDRSELMSLCGQVKLKGLRLMTRALPQWLSTASLPASTQIQGAQVQFQWNKRQGRLNLNVSKLKLALNRHLFYFDDLVFQVNQEFGHWYLQKITTRQLPVSTLATLIEQLHLRRGYFPLLSHLRPSGNVSFVQFVWNSNLAFEGLKLKLNRLSWSQWHSVPGFKNVNATVDVQNKKLQFQLASTSNTVQVKQMPYFHRYRSLRVQGEALYFGQNANVHFSQLMIDDGNVTANVHGYVLLRHHRSPKFNMLGAFTVKDVKGVKQYLPRNGLSKPLRRWLDQAFLGGALTNGQLLWRGTLEGFPYSHGGGRFVVSAAMNHFNLKFSPQWYPVEKMQGELSFVNQGLYLRASKALINGSHLFLLRAKIRDLSKPWVVLHSEAQGQLNSVIGVLRHSPLPIGHRLQHLVSQGPYRLGLGLKINLSRVKQSSVKGNLLFNQDALHLTKANINLSHVNGELDFTDKAMTGKLLQAQWLGCPIKVQVKTVHVAGNKMVDIVNRGQLAWSSILKWAGLPQWNTVLQGAAWDRVDVGLPYIEKQGMTIEVRSDLQGTRLALPVPFTKKAKQKKPFYLRWTFLPAGKNDVNFRLASQLGAQLHWAPASPIAGLIRLGHAVNMPTPNHQLEVIGHVSQINVESWVNWFKSSPVINAPAAASKVVWAPLKANVLVNRVQVYRNRLQHFLFKLSQAHRDWVARVSSPALAGGITIPIKGRQSNPWIIRVSKAYLPHSLKNAGHDMNPLRWPPLNVDIRNLKWGSRWYRHLRFQSRVHGHAVNLSDLKIVTPLLHAQGRGQWNWQAVGNQHVMLQGVVRLPQVGEWLHEFAHRDWVKGGQAGIAFKVGWPGSLMHPAYAKMSGRVNLKLDEGTLMVTQKVYHSLVLLRLLNVLGVQSLLENISTGFTPLWVRGLPFDRMGAAFSFDQGNVQLKRLTMASTSVNLQVNGNVNTLSKKLNLLLSVKPNLTSSVPLIAGLAGGPLVGAATWVVNKLVSPLIGHAAAMEYRLTGSWDHPKLVKAPVLNTGRTVV